MKTTITMTQNCVVEIDKNKFNKQFMKEFRESFYQFHTIEEHMIHLGQLFMRGIADNGSLIEGYGPAKEMGIKFYRATTTNLEVIE
jgi:hypothetical protein